MNAIFFFFFNDTATTEIYTLSLHDALPISRCAVGARLELVALGSRLRPGDLARGPRAREIGKHTSELQSRGHLVCRLLLAKRKMRQARDPAARTHQSRPAPKPVRASVSHVPRWCVFFLRSRPPPRSTLFPDTALFRSRRAHA